MPTTYNHTLLLGKDAEASLARELQRARRRLLRALLRTPGGSTVLDPAGVLAAMRPATGAPQASWRAFARQVAAVRFSSPDLCRAAEALAEVQNGSGRSTLLRLVREVDAPRTALIEATLPVVEQAAWRFAQRTLNRSLGELKRSHQPLLDDLIQNGTEVLMHAVDLFDPARGARLGYFLNLHKLPEAFREVCNQERHGRRVLAEEISEWNAVRQACEAVSQAGHTPAVHDLARSLGWSEARTERVLQNRKGVLSLDARWSIEGSDETEGPDGGNPQLAEEAPDFILLEACRDLHLAMAELPAPQQRLLDLQFGLNGPSVGSKTRIAKDLGITPRRFKDELQQAQAVLAKRLADHAPGVRRYAVG